MNSQPAFIRDAWLIRLADLNPDPPTFRSTKVLPIHHVYVSFSLRITPDKSSAFLVYLVTNMLREVGRLHDIGREGLKN